MPLIDSIFSTRYFSEKLKLNISSENVGRIGQTLFNSKISLNPHQIESALFYFKNPFSNGVILADEVGLGKTIEAGIIISQTWCERKRRILIISPASLIKQWQEELNTKFNLNAEILDRKNYNSYLKRGYDNPFDVMNKIFICSTNFASSEYMNIKNSNIDLVVIDEAHNLRNVYSKSNTMAKNILEGVIDKKKVLLTATPFQNSLMELYGITRYINNDLFGDPSYFKYKYIRNYQDNLTELRERLNLICKRTLRKQAEKYIKYSKRITNTFEFTQNDKEQILYNKITDLILDLRFERIFGKGRTQLIILIFRKLLSSSTYAVIGTLESIRNNIQNKKIDEIIDNELMEEIQEDEDYIDEIEDEEKNDIDNTILDIFIKKIDECIELAKSIEIDTKAQKLLEALNYSFDIIEKDKNRNKKILIFTESRRTQDYLYDLLLKNNYNKVLKFNGSNNDKIAKEIYSNWSEKQNQEAIRRNSKVSNIRQALLESFKNDFDIMIATEAAAEGLNMQFCSVMINYDLPWNPQRVEQRIGRCHRYGQINDVVVINMLNSSNAIDKRIYELLSQKMFLFNDVFGASDEILGRLEGTNELQKNIIEIYKKCRKPEDIDKAFDELQKLYEQDINSKMIETRKQLLDNFDEDIQKKFDNTLDETKKYLKEFETDFWRVLNFCLKDFAIFNEEDYSFKIIKENQYLPLGEYTILKEIASGRNIVTPNDTFGSKIIEEYYNKNEINGNVEFDLSNYKYRIKELEKIKNKSGIMFLSKLSISSFEENEFLLLDGILEDGTILDQESCQKIMRLFSNKYSICTIKENDELSKNHQLHIDSIVKTISEKNADMFAKESLEINRWAEDMTGSIQLKANILREKRKEKQRLLDYAITSVEQEELEKEISDLTKKIKNMWLELSDAEESVEEKRRNMISKLKREQMKTTTINKIFAIEFKVV